MNIKFNDFLTLNENLTRPLLIINLRIFFYHFSSFYKSTAFLQIGTALLSVTDSTDCWNCPCDFKFSMIIFEKVR